MTRLLCLSLAAWFLVLAVTPSRAWAGMPTEGHVLFGHGVNRTTLAVPHPVTQFHQGQRLYFTAHFGQQPGPTIRISLGRVRGAALSTVFTTQTPMPDPRYTIYANSMRTRGLASGRYQLLISAGSAVLASGRFTLVR